MKTRLLRTLIALGALITLTSFATAQQGEFGTFLDGSSGEATEATPAFGVDVAAYVHGDVMEEMPDAKPPADGGTDSSDDDSSDDDSTSDVCQCDCGSSVCECGSCNGCCDDCACGDSCSYGFCEKCGDCCCGECDACGDGCGNHCGDYSNCNMNSGMFYAEIQNMFVRTHVSSQVIGKLHEKYEWTPRIVLGYETANGIGGRMRWWSYSRNISAIPNSNSFHLDVDVLDAEGTARFSSKRADLLIAGGFRYASFEIAEDDDEVAADLPGLTFAADGRIVICCVGNRQYSGVCGARWSLLGGDWEGDDVDLLDDAPVFDDNVTAQEIYGGFEYLCHSCNYDLFARLVIEVQNWHSDAIGENSQTDSISFIGPAFHGGISF